jgi:Domain of unknown function (DUF4333)
VHVRILILASMIAFTGAACTRSLDSQGLEEQIVSELQDAGGPPVSEVTCPDDIEVEAGGTFECVATGVGVEWRVRVTQVDDDGNVEFEIVTG